MMEEKVDASRRLKRLEEETREQIMIEQGRSEVVGLFVKSSIVRQSCPP